MRLGLKGLPRGCGRAWGGGGRVRAAEPGSGRGVHRRQADPASDGQLCPVTSRGARRGSTWARRPQQAQRCGILQDCLAQKIEGALLSPLHLLLIAITGIQLHAGDQLWPASLFSLL